MHAYNRIPSSGHTTPSPPQSPLRSPRYRHGSGGVGRSKSGRFTPSSYPPGRSLAHRLAWFLLSALLRRQGIFLFAPLIYISGMLLYMGSVSLDVGPVIDHKPAPGSVYRSPQIYEKLRNRKGVSFEQWLRHFIDFSKVTRPSPDEIDDPLGTGRD